MNVLIDGSIFIIDRQFWRMRTSSSFIGRSSVTGVAISDPDFHRTSDSVAEMRSSLEWYFNGSPSQVASAIFGWGSFSDTECA